MNPHHTRTTEPPGMAVFSPTQAASISGEMASGCGIRRYAADGLVSHPLRTSIAQDRITTRIDALALNLPHHTGTTRRDGGCVDSGAVLAAYGDARLRAALRRGGAR